VLTGSRGGLLAAFVVTCSWALLLGGRYRRALWLAPVVIALALVIPGVGSRLATLSPLTGDGGVVPTEASLEGRIAAQRVAVEMTVDHPALGVGPGNFIAIEPEYLRSLGLDAIGLAPHNLYLEASAEGGLLGLAALVLLLGTAIVLAYRARVVARWAPDVVGTAVHCLWPMRRSPRWWVGARPACSCIRPRSEPFCSWPPWPWPWTCGPDGR
jgi:O-antigen ligase